MAHGVKGCVRWLWLALAWACSTSATGAEAEATPDPLAAYWQTRDELPAGAARRLPEWCDGAYRLLAFPHPRDVDANQLPIHAQAERGTYHLDERLELTGSVQLRRGNRSVYARDAVLDEVTELADLTGDVRLEEPGLVLIGERARVDLAAEAADIEQVTYLLTDAGFRGQADQITQDNGDLRIDRGSVTRCDPGSNTWRLDARRIEVGDQAVFGTARRATLRIGDVPVFYLPYLRFPVSDERQSGWLFPGIGYSGEDGLDLAAPYYLNLAPNWDATVTPRWLSKRGIALETELRHLNRYGHFDLGAAILPDDDLFDGELERGDFFELNPDGDFKPANRWLYALEHRGRAGRFETVVDYTAVSDPDYFRDLGTDLSVSSRVELERRGELSYARGAFRGRLWAQRFQRLDEIQTEAYQRLPQLDLTWSGNLLGPVQLNLAAQAVTFDRNNDDLSGSQRVVGDRFHLQPELRLPLSWPFAFVDLSAGLHLTRYDLRDVQTGVDAKPERDIGYGSLDMGLFFERDLNWFGRDLLQTLEPRAFYLYTERAAQDALPRFDVTELTFGYSQLFRRNRFSGLDRIADAHQVAVGVSSAFVDPRNGRELLRGSIGQIFYFQDRDVTANGVQSDDDRHSSSAIAGQLRGALGRHLSLSAALVWDPHDNAVDERALLLSYRASNRRIVNAGVRKRTFGRVDQTDLSFVWPLGRHWNLLGRWNYDLEVERTIEAFAGLEYNNCCWQARVVARRFIENPSNLAVDRVRADKGVFLQFVFKGLAGFGGRLDNVLSRGIRGFRANEASIF